MRAEVVTSSDCNIAPVNSKPVRGGMAYFFTLSAGIAKAQKTKEANPPDRKLEKPVLICSNDIKSRHSVS